MWSSRKLFARATRSCLAKSINNVTLVGVVHDIQSGYVFEDAVTQFTLTTTSIDSSLGSASECAIEKDHHTIRCFGDSFSADIKNRVKEGNIVCVNGRLRMNPQLEQSCNKHFYFPFVHVQPPNGNVAVIHSDRRKVPPPTSAPAEDIPAPVKEAAAEPEAAAPPQAEEPVAAPAA
jgi:hypothetical protein